MGNLALVSVAGNSLFAVDEDYVEDIIVEPAVLQLDFALPGQIGMVVYGDKVLPLHTLSYFSNSEREAPAVPSYAIALYGPNRHELLSVPQIVGLVNWDHLQVVQEFSSFTNLTSIYKVALHASC